MLGARSAHHRRTTVHLHRRAGRSGPGANGPGEAQPTFSVADFAGLLALLGMDTGGVVV